MILRAGVDVRRQLRVGSVLSGGACIPWPRLLQLPLRHALQQVQWTAYDAQELQVS